MTVAILFARADSNYKELPDVEVFDAERDARTYDGPWPVVAHPPCRAWGRLRAFANPRPDERNLGRLAVALVREFGGVLEHPAGSTLWDAQKLPRPGERDHLGGWTLAAPQKWWGHKAEKATWFYVVGCAPGEIPPLPYVMGEAAYVVQSNKRQDYRPHIPKAEREHTPPELARWLVELAARCKGHKLERNRRHAPRTGARAMSDGLPGDNVAPAGGLPWRCFHCDETFTDAAEAALHFGATQKQQPACQLNIKWLRYVERQLERYRDEDTDLHRQMHAMASRHQRELRQEEEKGYARGLRDGMAMTTEERAALTTPILTVRQ